MDPLEFIANLISSIAWPVVVVTLGLAFRKKIRKIIGAIATRIEDMTEFTGPGSVNAKFSERIREVTEVTSKHGTIGYSGPETGSSEDDNGHSPAAPSNDSGYDHPPLDIAHMSPRHAVLEAYIPLEKAAFDVVENLGGARKDLQMMLRNPVAALRRIQQVPSDVAASAAELRHLRNQAAHQETFTVDPAVVVDYVYAAQDLTKLLASFATKANNH